MREFTFYTFDHHDTKHFKVARLLSLLISMATVVVGVRHDNEDVFVSES